MPVLRSVPLGEVAHLNPTFGGIGLADSDAVDFFPMAAVDATCSTTTSSARRPYGDVRKGYTPFEDGDVLLAKITPCFENGKIAQARVESNYAFGSTEFHIIRPDSSQLDARYLVHFLRRDQVRVDGERKMTGSGGQRRVPKHFLESLAIPLPPVSEQRRIAAILDQADALRARRREALAQLDSLTQSIFIDMFGDPLGNSKGWQRCTLGELLLDGPQNGLYKPASDYGTGTPILRIDSFYDGVVTGLAALKRVRISNEELLKFGLCENDIVINRVNSPEYLGKSALVPTLSEPVVFESNMMRFSVKPERALARYVVAFLQTGFMKAQIRTASKDAVNQSSINQQDVKSFLVNLPPMQLQMTFAARLDEIERIRTASEASAYKLDRLFASVQHSAFRGVL